MRTFSMMAAALLACSIPAAAQAQVVKTDTTNAPLYFGGFPSIAVPFYVTTAGNYTLTQSGAFDMLLLLYTDFVDPADMNTNLLAGDDLGDVGVSETVIVPLLTNQQYIALLGGYSDIDFGETTLTFAGPDSVTLGALAGAIPEPATWAMMIGGFALAGAGLRRRATTVRFA